MTKILIIYSSTDGHTLQICDRLKQTIEQFGQHVTVVPVEHGDEVDMQAFDKIVIGARIRYGKHSKLIVDFIRANLPVLETKPSAFFSVDLVARKPEKSGPETSPYVRKFLQRQHPGNRDNWRSLPASWTIRDIARWIAL